jgi:hypothetical protein
MRWILVFTIALTFVFSASPASAQIQYRSGVDVTPAFEGWTSNPDGTFNFFFGYMNRNYEEELEIPAGPNNTVEPGGDRGQPTHFYPRRQHFVFKVAVPKDWGLQQKLSWTLTIRGKTNVAKGWLQPEWEINNQIMMENGGGGVDDENEAPTVKGSPAQTITLPGSATLSVTAQDDWRPKPKGGRGGNAPAQGLRISWIQYRSPGPVTFDPPEASAEYEKPLTTTTKATFKVPGVYVLRGIVSDGSLETPYDITVTVK